MYYIGMDIGGTKILGALFDEEGTIIKKSKKKTKANSGREEVFSQISKVIEELIEGVEKTEIKGIGAGLPGIIDTENGLIKFSPNLPWENYKITEEIENKFGFKMKIGNDVNVGILGEAKFGAAKGKKNVIGIFLGTGIGGGIILDGKLYTGVGGAAGEIGHINLNPDGPLCGCGAKGCLEAIASKTAMHKEIMAQLSRGRESILKEFMGDGKEILKSSWLKKGFEEKDELTMEILERSAKYLGIGVASLLNILNVDTVIFGGGVMEELKDELMPKVIQSAKAYTMPAIFKDCEFKIAELGDDAGIYGALSLVMGENE